MPMTLPFMTMAALQPERSIAISRNKKIFDFMELPPCNKLRNGGLFPRRIRNAARLRHESVIE